MKSPNTSMTDFEGGSGGRVEVCNAVGMDFGAIRILNLYHCPITDEVTRKE